MDIQETCDCFLQFFSTCATVLMRESFHLIILIFNQLFSPELTFFLIIILNWNIIPSGRFFFSEILKSTNKWCQKSNKRWEELIFFDTSSEVYFSVFSDFFLFNFSPSLVVTDVAHSAALLDRFKPSPASCHLLPAQTWGCRTPPIPISSPLAPC